MRANSPKQHCPALRLPWLELLLQLFVMVDGLSSNSIRRSRSDFPFSRPGRTALCVLMYETLHFKSFTAQNTGSNHKNDGIKLQNSGCDFNTQELEQNQLSLLFDANSPPLYCLYLE